MVGVGAGRSGSEAQVVMQVRGERSSPLGHALCTTKRRASEGRNGVCSVESDLKLFTRIGTSEERVTTSSA